MTVLQVVQTLQAAGFSGLNLVTATAVALAEGWWNTGRNNSTGNTPAGSVDRGLFQINSYWHSEVSDTCAADPLCNAKEALRISSGGTNFNQWTTYTTGVYLAHIGQAENAIGSLVGSVVGGAVGGSTGGGGGTTATNPSSLPSISIPGTGDLTSQIQAAAQGVVNSIGNAFSPIGQAIGNLSNLQSFLFSGQTVVGVWLLLAGAVITVLGIILFGVSLLPSGTQRAAANIVKAAA
jgi:hypothetical protein